VVRRKILSGLLMGALVCMAACRAQSAPPAARQLTVEHTIPLTGVAGRIDHLAYDAKRERVFIAELGNGSVEGVDLAAGRSIGRIGGLKEPQGLAFLPDRDELAVANGGDGTVRFYRAADLAPVGVMQVGADPDNLRVEPASGRLVVGYGAGALAVIDPATRRVVATTPLPAHPEGFQLDGSRAYVNLPDAGGVAAVDLASGRILATWRNPGAKWNFPLALEPAAGLVATVYRFPTRLVLWDAATGAVKQNLKTCGDADDAFFDRPRRRLYVICGSGAVETFVQTAGAYAPLGLTRTRSGARTGLLAPQIDRLFVAARAKGEADAALLVLRP
jgi:DNA-binding beta-propeller fold protein YncE